MHNTLLVLTLRRHALYYCVVKNRKKAFPLHVLLSRFRQGFLVVLATYKTSGFVAYKYVLIIDFSEILLLVQKSYAVFSTRIIAK